MKTLIERANDKGWTINAGTLQAQGLFNAYRNGAKTDDDVTVWCTSVNEAAKEALRMDKETRVRPNKKRWTVFDPKDKQYICRYSESDCAWSTVRDKAFEFDTKSQAQRAVLCYGRSKQFVIAAHEVRV
jgi:hypothetical protein